jgi:hypothetical protein
VRGSLSVGVWVLATSTAVGVSWLSVRSALVGAAPVAVPAVEMPTTTAVATTPAAPPSTSGPGVAATLTRPSTSPVTTRQAVATTAATSATTTTSAAGQISRYPSAGGVVVLSLTSTAATLVSATPAAGYSVNVWHGTDWLRVDFSSTAATWTVLASWNGHAPSVQTYQS